jgi:hypothetical protein
MGLVVVVVLGALIWVGIPWGAAHGACNMMHMPKRQHPRVWFFTFVLMAWANWVAWH